MAAVAPPVRYVTPVSMSPSEKSDIERADNVVMTYPPYVPLSQRIGDPAPLAMGGFATTLLTVSLSMMNFRGVQVQTAFAGDLCFVACVGLLISAQWEMIKGNTFSYTVLSAFAMFYGGYGALLLPSFGIMESYGGATPQYYNAMGFFILIWGVFNIFFLITSFAFNFVYICIFTTIELCLIFDAASWFTSADGNTALALKLMQVGGVWGFLAGLLGFYTTAHYLCEVALPFALPMGDTSRYFARMKKVKE